MFKILIHSIDLCFNNILMTSGLAMFMYNKKLTIPLVNWMATFIPHVKNLNMEKKCSHLQEKTAEYNLARL